jgi:hypothetical protein
MSITAGFAVFLFGSFLKYKIRTEPHVKALMREMGESAGFSDVWGEARDRAREDGFTSDDLLWIGVKILGVYIIATSL